MRACGTPACRRPAAMPTLGADRAWDPHTMTLDHGRHTLRMPCKQGTRYAAPVTRTRGARGRKPRSNCPARDRYPADGPWARQTMDTSGRAVTLTFGPDPGHTPGRCRTRSACAPCSGQTCPVRSLGRHKARPADLTQLSPDSSTRKAPAPGNLRVSGEPDPRFKSRSSRLGALPSRIFGNPPSSPALPPFPARTTLPIAKGMPRGHPFLTDSTYRTRLQSLTCVLRLSGRIPRTPGMLLHGHIRTSHVARGKHT